MEQRPIHRVVNLIEDDAHQILNMDLAEATSRLFALDASAVCGIEGSFALVARDGERVRLARSLDRPLRYFLAKEVAGPLLVVADRMDAIRAFLEEEGYGDQFHPTYTRMVPAHHVTEIHLVGCPDPNPTYIRFFDPPRGVHPADLDVIGERYVHALRAAISRWLDSVPPTAPLGVLFSGGLDSGTALLLVHDTLIARGETAQRLKAFTLAVDGGGTDVGQARSFLAATNLAFLGEEVDVPASAIDPVGTVGIIEDYKPLDVECAAMNVALLRGIRTRYPEWRYLLDGDGGDENFKDYPIEENAELTIRSVVNNLMLYQEGWGVEAIKHSLTYSGGLSRGCVRGFAPARHFGFTSFSPNTVPSVVAVAEGIPFADLTQGSHDRLYALKGEILSRGVRRVLGREMPVYPKCRFQHGAASAEVAADHFASDPSAYRATFEGLFRRAG